MNPIPIEDRGGHLPFAVQPSPMQQKLARAEQVGFRVGRAARIATPIVAAGAGGYLLARHHAQPQKKDAMSKNLVNPYEEVVVFGKAYPVALPVSSATTIRALVPTGSHVGHGNDLKVVRNSRGHGGRRAGLEHYTAKPKGLKQGPFGKAAPTGLARPGMLTAAKVAASGPGTPSTYRGLGMIANMKPPSKVLMTPQTPLRVRRARAAQGSVAFQNPGSRGTRLT
jgi:hypothetical protein